MLERDIVVDFVRVHRPVREMLDRAGVTEVVSDEHIHDRIGEAVLSHLRIRPDLASLLGELSGELD